MSNRLVVVLLAASLVAFAIGASSVSTLDILAAG